MGRKRSLNAAATPARIRQLEDELVDLRAELGRSEARVEAIRQIGQVLGSNLELDVLLERLVAKTTELLDADRSTVFFVDEATHELCSKVMQGYEHTEIRLPIGVGLAGWVAEHDEPVHIKDAYNDRRFNREVDRRSGYRTRNMLVWPIRNPHRGGVSGVIQVLNKNTGAFDRTDERLLSAIASEIGVALAASRLYREVVERNEELERAKAELALLFQTERAISESTDLEPMLESILSTALTRFDARSGAIYLFDDRKKRLDCAAAAGVGSKSLARLSYPAREACFRSAIEDGQASVIERPRGLSRGRLTVRQLMVVPITNKYDGVIGVLELLDRKGGSFAEEDLSALQMVGAQAGRAIYSEKQRRAREQAENLETIGRMLSGIVHDMRTPLTLVAGYAQVMAGSDDAEDRKAYSHTLLRQVDLMSSMTKDLLAFARGEQSVLVRKVYVDRFMTELREYLETEFDGTGVKLTVEVRYKGAARFDETKVRRVFHNLARNAREAMPGGGQFRVTVSKKKDRLVFEFADNGPGIPEALRDRMFEPFATYGKVGGTGLGLTMVRRIAEEHGGSVDVKTSSKGTKFTVSIPAD